MKKLTTMLMLLLGAFTANAQIDSITIETQDMFLGVDSFQEVITYGANITVDSILTERLDIYVISESIP